MDEKQIDPKGLMREAYRIPAITKAECRSIFLDWALGLPMDEAPALRIKLILEQYGAGAPDHPMTEVLKEGLADQPEKRRRGGRRGRQV